MATKKAPTPKAAAKKAAAPATSASPAKAAAAKKMSKTELVRLMAERMELTTKQSASFFDILAQTAIQETKSNGSSPSLDLASW